MVVSFGRNLRSGLLPEWGIVNFDPPELFLYPEMTTDFPESNEGVAGPIVKNKNQSEC